MCIMATLQEEEAGLEAQIQTYRDQVRTSMVDAQHCTVKHFFPQLAAVREKVVNGAGEELKQLLKDLEQLIDLSEGIL